jgi:serine O-acetyltransferase
LISPFVRCIILIVQKTMEVITGVSIPAECAVGPGLYIGHFGTIIINGDVEIGVNCNLSQGVTLGMSGRGEERGCPSLGDRVYIGPHAILIGRIRIGHDVAIGAGAVVTKPVPDRAVVVGNPARIISYLGSFDFVTYDGMDCDPDRRESLQRANCDSLSEASSLTLLQ